MNFLIEIGSEELPHAFIDAARNELGKKTDELLSTHAFNFTEIKTFSTPRRLAVMVTDSDACGKDRIIEKDGPPLVQAYKANSPAPAGTGFAKNFGISLPASDKLIEYKMGMPDGIYYKNKNNRQTLFGRITVRGKTLQEIIGSEFEKIIAELSFPKKMRWGNNLFLYARPITWVCALSSEGPLDLSIAGLKSSSDTFGHRILYGDRPITLKKPDDYPAVLRQAYVLADHNERLALIHKELDRLEKEKNLKILEREKVASRVVNLTEYPFPVLSSFNQDFLTLPAEVLTSVMADQQMYFPAADQKNNISVNFVITANIPGTKYIENGNQRVISARFSDARFLFKEDCKNGLRAMSEKLSAILYQKDLGTMTEKVKRILSAAELINLQLKSVIPSRLNSVISLMKNDLASHMVYEFPHLQGIMGRYYALHDGLDQETADAISDHYLPRYAGDNLPRSDLGKIAALADKIETITGCFCAGLAPTGSSDPYALRRQTIGMVKIIIEAGYRLNLLLLTEKLLPLYSPSSADVLPQLTAFYNGRIKTIFRDYGFSHDEIDAGLSGSTSDIYAAWLKIKALHDFRTESAQFAEMAEVTKRISNIVKDNYTAGVVNPSLFEEPVEHKLDKMLTEFENKLPGLLENDDYHGIFRLIASFHIPLQEYFKNVMVICENETIRHNRIRFLGKFLHFINNILDFNRIIT
ncbi:MAG TPA: glycine--tRNA ligase subunit beta [Spirochaetia bacterium]|nr:glycine--tRNA ligase subunit beta [Spirochaetia bacterium]